MCILFLISLSILNFYDMIDARYVFVSTDLGYYFMPPKYLYTYVIKTFEIPLWNPHNFSGLPLMATLQPGVFYPPNILYLLLPFNIAWNWLIILHFTFSGISMFYLIRYIGGSKKAAFLSSIIFMLSGYLYSNHCILSYFIAITWGPIIILFSQKLSEAHGQKNIVILSFLFAIQFFAGAPEISLQTFLLICFFTFFPLKICKEDVSFKSKIKNLFLFLMLSFLLTSIQLIPFYELKNLSIRNEGISYKDATIWSLGFCDLLQFFLAGFRDYHFDKTFYLLKQSYFKTLYFGATPFIFSSIYFMTKDKRRFILIILIAFSLLLSFGKNTPIYKFIHYIPIFNSIRYPVKFIFIFVFIITITTGLGFDKLNLLYQNKYNLIKIFYFIFTLYISCVTISFCLTLIYPDIILNYIESIKKCLPNEENSILNLFYLKRFLFFAAISGFIIILLIYSKIKIIYFSIMIIILIFDLIFINFKSYSKIEWSHFINTEKINELMFIKRNDPFEKIFITPDTYNIVLFSDIYTRTTFPFNFAPIFGYYNSDGYEALEIKKYNQFKKLLENPISAIHAKNLLDIAGIKYIISSMFLNEQDIKKLDTIYLKYIDFNKKRIFFYKNNQQTARIKLFYNAYFISDENEIIKNLYYQKHDLKKTLLISSKEDKIETYQEGNGEVKLISYKPNEVVLNATTDTDAFLYVSDTWYPGWRAYIDGRKTEIFRANLTFRAIKLPKGTHEVVFKYRPMSFYIGALLTLFGVLLSIALIIRDKKLTQYIK